MTKQEFLAMSLPYELKIKDSFSTPKLTGIMDNEYHFGSYLSIDGVEEIKPILRPLSDLTKPIEHKGETFVPLEKIEDIIGSGWCEAFEEAAYVIGEWDLDMLSKKVTYLPFEFIRLFTSWYFDVADLISKGEAIDVNSLDINPYK